MTRTPTGKIFSGTQLLGQCAIQKASHRIGWETARRVPAHILTARAIQEYKDTRAEAFAQSRASDVKRPAALGIGAVLVGTSQLRLVGFDKVVASEQEALDFAHSVGRSFVRVGQKVLIVGA